MPVSRRGLLAGAVVAGAAAAVPEVANAATTSGTPSAGERVGPQDARFQDLVQRGQNKRFTARPDYVRVIRTTDDALQAVQDAVTSGKRIAVRGGGHGFEDFVDNSEVEVLLDMSPYSEVRWDERYRAFSIGSGATLGNVYRELFFSWGVTLPGGGCGGVGVGGHFSGGGYGALSRQHGSVVDHLYGVEIVVVDARGRARVVVATRDNAHRDLWWAHTGGGGGNFGVVTRYLMRSAAASGRVPEESLPKAPASLLTSAILYDWKTVDEGQFQRIVRNWFRFYERHNTADSPYASLWGPLIASAASAGSFVVTNQMDATVPDARGLMEAYHAALIEGLDLKPEVIGPESGPFWRATALRTDGPMPSTMRQKLKAGYLRKGYTDAQISTMYAALTDESQTRPEASFLLVPYGGKVNTVPSDATATPQRDVVAKMVLTTSWEDPKQDAMQLAWMRKWYGELYKDTGGAPVPNAINAGSYINYPDVDLADPEFNTSGVPWHDLYYLGNYPRLRQIKTAWDPRNVFRHKMSIEPL
ncbi:BBE domain-containing protein [Streptomyces sp. NPDC094034]|uniref:FAD-dependent oxidoreductase n=1 Tax=Streptomyces sp. NPDC094034 TaxID=3155309 RepID=UPI00332D2B75